MSSLFVVNAFRDLKMKSSGGGGLSDGGVINRTVILKEAEQTEVVVEIAPPYGVAYAGIALRSPSAAEPSGPALVNFGSGVGDVAECLEYFVAADGTEVATGGTSGSIGPQVVAGIGGGFFTFGGVLQYPNKLRYKLNPLKGPSATGRLSLKYTLMQFDRPSDQG